MPCHLCTSLTSAVEESRPLLRPYCATKVQESLEPPAGFVGEAIFGTNRVEQSTDVAQQMGPIVSAATFSARKTQLNWNSTPQVTARGSIVPGQVGPLSDVYQRAWKGGGEAKS